MLDGMSKGSKRRPACVDEEEFAEAWERAFGEKAKVTFVSDDVIEVEVEFEADELAMAMIEKGFNTEH